MPKFIIEKMPHQDGKIAIVTGANSGVGYHTTVGLAERGAHVVMACRNMEKAAVAKTKIESAVPNASLEIIELDTSKLTSVRVFAKAFQVKHQKLDLLINNAGIMATPQAYTEDGFENQLATNYIGHFLLTSLLMPELEAAPAARVVTLSSIAHKRARIHFDDLQFKQKYARWEAYGQTKLACLMFAYELDRRLKARGSSVISLASHPGVSNTNLGAGLPWYYAPLMPMFAVMGHAPDKAAEPSLMAALHPNMKGGEYIGPTGTREMSGNPWMVQSTPQSKDEAKAGRLWAWTAAETGV